MRDCSVAQMMLRSQMSQCFSRHLPVNDDTEGSGSRPYSVPPCQVCSHLGLGTVLEPSPTPVLQWHSFVLLDLDMWTSTASCATTPESTVAISQGFVNPSQERNKCFLINCLASLQFSSLGGNKCTLGKKKLIHLFEYKGVS